MTITLNLNTYFNSMATGVNLAGSSYNCTALVPTVSTLNNAT